MRDSQNNHQNNIPSQYSDLTQVGKTSLVKSAMSQWSIRILLTLIGFLITPFLIRQIGKTNYGFWNLIGSILGYYGLLNFGVDSAARRYIAKYAAQKDLTSLNKVVATSLLLFIFTAAATVILSFILATPIVETFNVPLEVKTQCILTIKILAFSSALGFIASLYKAIYTAHELFTLFNTLEGAMSLLRFALMVIALLLKTSLPGLAFANLITIFIKICLYHSFINKRTPWVKLKYKEFEFSIFKKLIAFGSMSFIITVADILRFKLDNFVIAKFINLDKVAIYSIAAFLISKILIISVTILTIFTSRFTILHAQNNRAQIANLFYKLLAIFSALNFGILLGIFLFGKAFILFWVGKDFAEAGPILIILTFSYSLALAQSPGNSLLRALNKHRFFAIATIIEALANLTLSLILVHSLGMIGVALGTAIPMTIVKLIQPFYVSKVAKLDCKRYLRLFLEPSIYTFILIVLSAFMNKYIINNDIIMYACNFTALGVYALAIRCFFLRQNITLKTILNKK